MAKRKEEAGMGLNIDEGAAAPRGDVGPTQAEARKEATGASVPAFQEPPRCRRSIDAPHCPIHMVPMRSYHSSGMFTYYKCPCDACRETGKKVRAIGPLKNRYGHGESKRE